MDTVGPFPTAATQKKFLLVATDYFSKWVEAEAYASIKDKDVKRFLRGTSHQKNLYSQPRYPQSNGQAEVTNKTLLRNTPFDLTYGTDAVIPTEVGMPTARTAVQGQRNEDDELAKYLDRVDEAREAASIRMTVYQQKVAAYYNRKANWEGPYVVSKPSENWSRPPCDAWHSSLHPGGNSSSPTFHPDISAQFYPTDIPSGYLSRKSYPKFFSADIPPGYLTSGSGDVPPSLDISHPSAVDVPLSSGTLQSVPVARWERKTIQLHQTDMSESFSDA
ncbi:hypothetical protein CK203_103249 [Vitis vinifera]|uniref:Integrase catalytic domain-containing protein n=1 Tax=Vitis vinifera TaxID=29760 RepID=A0A438D8A6_VITVI|nr:hypothetical protein CK203_103249 [Vitis vinifera]